jgi:hypothetical protein
VIDLERIQPVDVTSPPKEELSNLRKNHAVFKTVIKALKKHLGSNEPNFNSPSQRYAVILMFGQKSKPKPYSGDPKTQFKRALFQRTRPGTKVSFIGAVRRYLC